LTQVDHVEAEAREPAPINDAEEARRRDRAARNARSKARKFVKRLEQLDLDDYTEDEQLAIREAAVRLREIGGDPRPAPPRPPSPLAERSYPPLLDVVFEVLSGVLDTRTFTKAKKALLERFAEE
jgi:hypothetical protein